MKQTADLDRAQSRLRAGTITRDGFLGEDRRALVEILDDDLAAVQRLGLTHARIAARLRELRDAGAPGLGLAVRVGPDLEVAVEGERGGLPCPFGHPGLLAKVNVAVHNARLGVTLRYTDASVHLIGAHGFYGGRGSAYRLDPGFLARVLGLGPEDQG